MTRGVDLYADRTSTATMRANQGRIVLAWRTNIAGRWLDPQQHDGTATPDNLLNALHDGLIKNSGAQRFDHLALAEKYEFAEDAESCTFTLRPGVKFHDGSPLTPQDVTWSSEHYRGAWAKVLHEKTGRIEVPRRPHGALRVQGAVPRFSDPDGYVERVRRRMGGPGKIL